MLTYLNLSATYKKPIVLFSKPFYMTLRPAIVTLLFLTFSAIAQEGFNTLTIISRNENLYEQPDHSHVSKDTIYHHALSDSTLVNLQFTDSLIGFPYCFPYIKKELTGDPLSKKQYCDSYPGDSSCDDDGRVIFWIDNSTYYKYTYDQKGRLCAFNLTGSNSYACKLQYNRKGQIASIKNEDKKIRIWYNRRNNIRKVRYRESSYLYKNSRNQTGYDFIYR